MISKKVTKTKRIRKKLNQYERFVKDEPEFPDYTCPHIDTIIDWMYKSNEELEKLRTMNAKLRDSAEYWKNSCEEMQEIIDRYAEKVAEIKIITNRDI
jgi:cyclopropane fatty-acyl-phospholipid synthase-like methyltransferase